MFQKQNIRDRFFYRSGDFVVCISNQDENLLEQVFLLRHQIFAEKLGWVEKKKDLRDEDEYDKDSFIFAIINEKEKRVLGTFRITPHEKMFMLEKAFMDLKQNVELVKNEQTIEMSRLVIDHSINNKNIRRKISLMLYRSLYIWCRSNGIQYIYLVSTKRYLKRLSERLHVPIHQISTSEFTDDGEEYYAGMLDLIEAKKAMGFIRFGIFRYMRL